MSCTAEDCIVFFQDVSKIITLLEELKRKLTTKINNTRNTREHIALKYAKGIINSHLETSSEIQEQLEILWKRFKKFKTIKTLILLRNLYKLQIQEFLPIYKLYSSMLD
jgi:hypothetical protein